MQLKRCRCAEGFENDVCVRWDQVRSVQSGVCKLRAEVTSRESNYLDLEEADATGHQQREDKLATHGCAYGTAARVRLSLRGLQAMHARTGQSQSLQLGVSHAVAVYDPILHPHSSWLCSLSAALTPVAKVSITATQTQTASLVVRSAW